MKIYFSKDDQLIEKEISDRCCRTDVLVEINGRYYQPNITMVVRIVQELEDAIANHETYLNEPCQIIVSAVDKQSIINAIICHYKNRFFEDFKPIDMTRVFGGQFPQYTKIDNWVLVYDSEQA